MAKRSEANGIVYNLENCKRQLHAAEIMLIENKHKREQAEKVIEYMNSEETRLLKSIESNKLSLHHWFQKYVAAGQGWMKIEAVDIPLEEEIP